MIARASERVAVAGLTGKQGRFWSARMRECGTSIVAGTSPGKGGQEVDGIPVYDSLCDARAAHDIDLAVLFTPPLVTRAAVSDALAAGIMRIVVLTEHIPVHDVMCFLADARDAGAQVIGPNTAGIVTPGEAAVGIMPAHVPSIFKPGSVGIVSRSGSLGTLVCLNVVRAGYGESAFIGIGGDPVLGTTTRDALEILDRDPRTKAAVIVGELGGAMEEDAAEYARSMRKPVLAFIAGRTAPPGRRMGHAGAIVDGARGTGESKVTALRDAGVRVAETPSEIGVALRAVLA